MRPFSTLAWSVLFAVSATAISAPFPWPGNYGGAKAGLTVSISEQGALRANWGGAQFPQALTTLDGRIYRTKGYRSTSGYNMPVIVNMGYDDTNEILRIEFTSFGSISDIFGAVSYGDEFTQHYELEKIKPLAIGDTVVSRVALRLYIGSEVVGTLPANEPVRIYSLQNTWAAVEKLDGTLYSGWVELGRLERYQK